MEKQILPLLALRGKMVYPILLCILKYQGQSQWQL